MKLRFINYVSAVCFVLSSTTLLFIPLLNFDSGFPAIAFYLAGLFWIMFFLGIALQFLLCVKTKHKKVRKSLKLQRKIVARVLGISVIALLFVLTFLRANPVALPINLFALLISIESLSVIRRMEKLL